jgi:hypothetical protein
MADVFLDIGRVRFAGVATGDGMGMAWGKWVL